MKDLEKLRDHLEEVRRKIRWVEKKMLRFEEILRKRGKSEEEIREIMRRYGR